MINPSLKEKADQAVREFLELIELGLINTEGEFVCVLNYPPMLELPPITEADFFKGYKPPQDNKFAVYAHIPFCKQRCAFCHTPNVINSSDSEKDSYLDHIEKELAIHLARLGVGRIKATSILLGGGTPTCLTPAQLERFLKAFTSRMDIAPSVQFTCDIDPLTVIGYEGRERLKILKSFNVNRLSMGVQAFSDEMLREMTRLHTSADAVRAIGQAAELGFRQEIELIYGYPGETEEHWAEAVEQALRCETDEIMIFRLMLIPNAARAGAIARMLNKRGNILESNKRTIRFKAIAHGLLEDAGYTETLQRSFSKQPDWFSNYRNDWTGLQRDTISFGYYAMSMFRDRCAQNTHHLKEYYRGIRENRLPLKTGLVRNRDQQLRRNIAMPLRNRDLDKRQFLAITGAQVNEVFGKKIELLKGYGLLEENAEVLKPTKKGRFFISDIAQLFYHPDFMPFPRAGYRDGPLNPYHDN
ncbi:MAG: coproporphyrinogen III oxidase family protein [Elusimicrobia bacterium]|nr:coproporphyrinogen III oxidase family protein [Elusimicrobiota bacterium]